ISPLRPFHLFEMIETPCIARLSPHIDVTNHVTKWGPNGGQTSTLERAKRAVFREDRHTVIAPAIS
ncbi:hypothetical protein, partial [Bacillus pumilus]|uniref:hypothetical protein n=1 Tax=Bacillus pumilus TaxID=1408 RepID=UPI003D073CED